MNLVFLPVPVWNQSSWIDSWLKWYQHKTATSASGACKKWWLMAGISLFSLVLTDIEWIYLFRFNALNDIIDVIFIFFFNSLWPQFFMEAWACWRLTHNVERFCCSCHHMNWQWVLLWPPCQYLQQFLLILESLFTVCSSTMSDESELNDDSEAWWCSNSVGSILSELSMYTVGATSCSIFTPVKQTVPHLK